MRGASALAGEIGVKGGVAIHQTFPYCKMMCEQHSIMWKNVLLCLGLGTSSMTWW